MCFPASGYLKRRTRHGLTFSRRRRPSQVSFSDLSNSNLRPAVVLANADRNDWILCQITSNAFADDVAIAIDNVDFRSGGLNRISYARTGKLFTANEAIIVRTAGKLSAGKFNEIISGIVSRFKTLNRE